MEVIYLESLDENVRPNTDKPYEMVIIRKPKPPKVAKVKRFKQCGVRHWATIYRVKDESSNILHSDAVLKEAINYAKGLAIKHLKDYYVSVDKALINADPIVAVVSPGKHKLGKFKFHILDSDASAPVASMATA